MEHQLVTKDEKVKLERDLKAMIDRRPVISKAIGSEGERGLSRGAGRVRAE